MNHSTNGPEWDRDAQHALARSSSPQELARHQGGGPPAGEEEEGGRALQHTLSLLLQAKWTILSVFVILSAIGLPLIWTMIKPVYRATARVRIAPENLRMVFDTDEPGLNQYYPIYFATQQANLTSANVLQAALERPEVQATRWYRDTPKTLKTMLGGAPPNHFQRLKKAIEVEPEGQTDVLDIHIETVRGEDAPVLANAVLDAYIASVQDESSELEKLRFKTLREEHAALVKEIEKLVERRGELSKQLGTDDPDIVRAQLAQQVGQLEMERKTLNRQYELMRWDLQARAEAKGEAPPTETVEDVDDAARFASDPVWSRLNQELQAAREEIMLAEQRYGEAHPRMKELRSQEANKKRLLAQRERQLGPGAMAGTTGGMQSRQTPTAGPTGATIATGADRMAFLDDASLRWMVRRYKRELELLDAEIAALRDEQESKGEMAKQVAQLNDQLRRQQELEEAIHNRIQALEIEHRAPGRISVATRAVPVSEPETDKRVLLSLMTLAGSLFVGVALAQLRLTMQPRIFAAQDVQRSARVPFLGQLPAAPVATSLADDGDPLVGECMRMVRTALLERLDGGGGQAVMITSASSAAGKTSVAIELAKSLARLGKKTLLVEADLRRPTLAKRLAVTNDDGLCALLQGEADDTRVVTQTIIPNLSVVFAGRRPEVFDPEILANGVFAASLKRWKSNFDFVLIDSAPILPVADSRIIARQVDGAIMVSRSWHCRRSDVIQACADLSAAGGPLLGSVLVGVRPGRGYGYGYTYDYQYEETT